MWPLIVIVVNRAKTNERLATDKEGASAENWKTQSTSACRGGRITASKQRANPNARLL